MDDQRLMAEIGASLWGSNWQERLAAALRDQGSSLSDWQSGRARVPAAAWKQLREMVRQHALRLSDLDARIVSAYDAAYQRETNRR
jgi:hypothetical protein